MVEHHLLLGALDYLLLDAGLGDEAIHVHLLLLPDPVGAGLRLNHTENTCFKFQISLLWMWIRWNRD